MGMSLYDLLQGAIVGGAILASALYALGRIVPNARKRCATWLAGSTQPRWLQYVGAKLAGGSGGCGDGCGTCGSCGPTSRVEDNQPAPGARKIPVEHL
jgi:hypothetical protein